MRGGPADGLQVVPWQTVYVWLDSFGNRYQRPHEGAGLYVRRHDGYQFCGHERRLCEGCGSVILRYASWCPLCGHGFTR